MFASVIAVLLLVLVILSSCSPKTSELSPKTAPPPAQVTAMPTSTPLPSPSPSSTPTQFTEAEVVRVIDGDTIEVNISGRAYTVRYIGIDTPETVHPSKPVEYLGKEASNKNRELVEGKVVRLEKDVSETDKYGRLLRYVYVGELFVNAELVRLGYAQVATYPPDVKYQEFFLALQGEAREAGRGLWATTTPTPTPTPTPMPTLTRTPSQQCDPAYPGVCIPSPPPDLDCGEIPYKNFRVLPPDPHRFDGDKDGIGCER